MKYYKKDKNEFKGTIIITIKVMRKFLVSSNGVELEIDEIILLKMIKIFKKRNSKLYNLFSKFYSNVRETGHPDKDTMFIQVLAHLQENTIRGFIDDEKK